MTVSKPTAPEVSGVESDRRWREWRNAMSSAIADAVREHAPHVGWRVEVVETRHLGKGRQVAVVHLPNNVRGLPYALVTLPQFDAPNVDDPAWVLEHPRGVRVETFAAMYDKDWQACLAAERMWRDAADERLRAAQGLPVPSVVERVKRIMRDLAQNAAALGEAHNTNDLEDTADAAADEVVAALAGLAVAA